MEPPSKPPKAALGSEGPQPIALPPALQAAIKQLVPSEDPLDQPNFNSIEYINALFPTEQSLSDINDVIAKLKQKVTNTEREIGHQVRAQSGTTHRGQRDVEHAKAAIQDLFAKINDIKKKAEQSEKMVEELCSGIKTLDTAKQHLRATVAALRRLHMLVTGVSQLKELVATKQFKECANLLQAVNELSSYFEKYKGVPKIAELNAEVATARDALIQLVNHEFTQEKSQHLADAALVIDAMGGSQKSSFITWFCTRELDEYRRGFRSDDESAKLEYTERRFFWVKKAWQRFDDSYANVFPPSWRMSEHVTEEFAFLTREQLLQELDRRTNRDTLDVGALIRALQKTIEFEKEVAERYNASPLEDLTTETKDVKDEMAQEGDLRTVIGMRSNWRKFYRQRMKDMLAVISAPPPVGEDEDEVEAEERLQQNNLLQNEVKSLRWKGIISQAFDGYLRPFIQDQDRHMAERFDQYVKAETWSTPETERSKYLSSAISLINYFQNTLKSISELTRGKAFFEVFQLFKKYYGQYCAALSAKLPTVPTSGVLKLTEKEERTICLIINTAEWCGSTTTTLTDRIKERIDSKWTASVDLTEECENFLTVVANGIKLLVIGLEGKLEPALNAMVSKVPWGTLESTGDQSEYATTICAVLSQTAILYDQLLSAKHFGFFCDKFISSFCPHLKANIYNCKLFSPEGTEQLLIDMSSIKLFLLELPSVPSNAQAQNSLLPVQPRVAPKQYVKLVKKQMEHIEMFVKVLSSPPELLVNNYKALIGEGTEADFLRIMDLKGIPKKEQPPLVERFRHASGTARPTDQSGNFRRLLSFTSDLL